MSSFVDIDVGPDVVSRAKAGDRDAHETIYRQFSRPVYSLAYRIVRRPDLAEEALQEVFVEVLRKIDGFRGEAPLGAWIRRIAVNKCLMHLRSAWNRYSEPLDGPPPAAPATTEPSRSAAVAIDLEAALDTLAPTSRVVIWLHDVEGYTHREIAELMGHTESFSKSQLARAHEKLRAVLEPQSDKETQQCMHVPNIC